MKFSEGEVIREVELAGKKIILRVPRMKDWENLWENFKSTIIDTEFLAAETVPPKDSSKKFLKEMLGRMKEDTALFLVAETDGRVVGACDVRKDEKEVFRHRASFGINIIDGYRGMGLGKMMMETILGMAKDIGVEIIVFGYIEGNTRAKRLYEKMGCKQLGVVKKGVKRKDKYLDETILVKHL